LSAEDRFADGLEEIFHIIGIINCQLRITSNSNQWYEYKDNPSVKKLPQAI
jgi:hypothetical protein